MSEVIRVTEPRELLALIPYQLGFTPTDSLVVVSLRGDRSRVGLIARVDLHHTADAAATLVGHLLADGAARIVAVTYTDDTAAAAAATDLITEAAEAAGLSTAAWTVTSTGYRTLGCTDPNCCPSQGRPLADLTGTTVAATLTVRGVAVVADRAALGVTPATGPSRADAVRAAAAWLRTHTTGTVEARTAGLAAWRAALDTDEVPPATLGVLSGALTDVLVRDAALCTVVPDVDPTLPDAMLTGAGATDRAMLAILSPTDGVPPAAAAERAAALLALVAAHSTTARAAAPLTLLAILAWWSGDGARAGVLVDQARTADPDYRLAALVRDILSAGLAPGWVRRSA